MNPILFEAIRALYPEIFCMRGEDTFDKDDNPVAYDKDLVAAELARLQAVYDAKEYKRQRVVAYPSIPDQLDTIFHDGLDAWKATIQAVKDKYPKE